MQLYTVESKSWSGAHYHSGESFGWESALEIGCDYLKRLDADIEHLLPSVTTILQCIGRK